MDRPLLLNGLMATGKSTVGRRVAQLAQRPFVDLDESVAREAGKPVHEIFAEDGEGRFRALERAALERILDARDGAVVALGGGALSYRPVRLDALDRAVVVTLTAAREEILRRTAQTRGRPLLDAATEGDRALLLARLLDARRVGYSEAHARLPTDARPPDAVAREVLEVWQRDPLVVAAGERSYCIDVGRRCTRARLPDALHAATDFVLVTDRNVAPLHASSIEALLRATSRPVLTHVLDPGERSKRPAVLEGIWAAAARAGVGRGGLFVALGGGVVTDLTGFAAATWARGTRWVALPTTLLAMVDAAVGGKTAVDVGPAKNAAGAFWQPGWVCCDVDLESTEPSRGFTSALAEVVKTALVGDPELFRMVQSSSSRILRRDPDVVAEIVRRCVRVKARVVGLDEREGGTRAALNLGHTVGHALEAAGAYATLTHGEAVSLGLVAALRLGVELGVTPPELAERTTGALAAVGLPTELRSQPLEDAARLIGHDKKRRGQVVRLALASAPGHVELRDVALAELRVRVGALRRPG